MLLVVLCIFKLEQVPEQQKKTKNMQFHHVPLESGQAAGPLSLTTTNSIPSGPQWCGGAGLREADKSTAVTVKRGLSSEVTV